jgi:hypothetical protein
MRLDLVRHHGALRPSWAGDRRVRGRPAGAPLAWVTVSRVSSGSCCHSSSGVGCFAPCRPKRSNCSAATRWLAVLVSHGPAPRFWLHELLPAPETEAFDRGRLHKPAPDASTRHVFKAMSAAMSTRGDATMRIGRHAARSNIHFGSSASALMRRHPDCSRGCHRLASRSPHGHEQHAQTTHARDRGPRVRQSYGRYLVALYNIKRSHSSLGWQTPLAFAANWHGPSAQWDRALSRSGASRPVPLRRMLKSHPISQ